MRQTAKVISLYNTQNEEKIILEEFVKLIRWASRKYSWKLSGRYDYWDFFEDGLLILSLCLCKWRLKDVRLEDKNGFRKYFKTALFNRFRQIEMASHCKKRFGIHTPLDFASQVSCDGGFGEVHLRELVEHINSFLESDFEKWIFSLMVDPPEDLIDDALYEMSRKRKQALLLGTYDLRTVKISKGCLFAYVNKHKKSSEHGFLKAVKRIRSTVRNVVDKKEEFILK
jgi:hypothetical protein